MKKSSGFALIVILIALAVLTITAGGVVIWKEKVAPTPTPAPTPQIQPTPTTSPGVDEKIQTEGQCSRESGIDTCPQGYICYWSWECPRGMQDCGSPTGDFLCHKKCQSNSDCPSSMPSCKEMSLFRGDYGGVYRMCMK